MSATKTKQHEHATRKMSAAQIVKATVQNAISRRRDGKLLNPVPGFPVSYAYGIKSSAYAAGRHTGEDHSTDGVIGKPIQAVSKGLVVEASESGGTWGPAYGTVLVIQFTNEKGVQYRYGYCHLSRIDVAVGQAVEPGQPLGLTGNSGNSTGPHCHFEARKYPFHYGDDVHPILVKRAAK